MPANPPKATPTVPFTCSRDQSVTHSRPLSQFSSSCESARGACEILGGTFYLPTHDSLAPLLSLPSTVGRRHSCARKTEELELEWRNCLKLPSRTCKLTSSLTARAYSVTGQAASTLHAMVILQVYQAKALKDLHDGNPDPKVMQELRPATDYALQATKFHDADLWSGDV